MQTPRILCAALAALFASPAFTADTGKAPQSLDDLFALPADEPVSPAAAKNAKPPQSATGAEPLPQTAADLFGEPPAAQTPSAAKPASGDAPPASADALFGELPPVSPPSAQAAPGAPVSPAADTPPATADALFAEPLPAAAAAPQAEPAKPAAAPKSRLRGYSQLELARTYASPGHWSKAVGRLELGSQGRLENGAQWKLSGRVNYNAAFDLTDHYQSEVRDDQRAEFLVRETYLDFTAGSLDWRVGRQNIVWGEMVGMFLADVVSAKDLREFILPDFQTLRIPQWAARAEYFGDDIHAEWIWIPFPSFDKIGIPQDFASARAGADFYPYPPVPGVPTILGEDTPGVSLDHANVGMNVSRLKDGWNIAGFFYSSMNAAATYYPVAANVYQPRHDRIGQLGGSLSKDMGSAVLKAEAVYTRGRGFNRTTTGEVVKQNMLDWAAGLDFNPDNDTRMNVQFIQSIVLDRDAAILPDEIENGATFFVSRALPNKWRAELFYMRSLNRTDWMLRPKLMKTLGQNLKLSFGVDVFNGPITGLFGQYDNKDRAFVELRHDF